MSLSEELIQFLELHVDGASDVQLQDHFKERYSSLPGIINGLLAHNRLKLFTLNGSLIYKAVNEAVAAKFEGLGLVIVHLITLQSLCCRPEQMLVYQACERAGDKYVNNALITSFVKFLYRGIWTRDIKLATNISQQVLTKILKQLEQRNLLKTVRSVTSKSKKLYMIYDMVPAKELTGGPW